MLRKTGELSLCLARVGEETFGFDMAEVREVLGACVLTRVPLTPDFVAGVIPYRGEVLMVVSLRRLLGMEELSGAQNIVVLEDEEEGEVFGVAVDSMGDMLRLDGGDMAENPAALDAMRGRLFAGVYRRGEQVVIQLKPELLWPMRLVELLGPGPEGNV